MKLSPPFLAAAGAALALAAAAAAQEPPLVKASPFSPAGAPAAQAAPVSPYQLTGVTVMPQSTRVCIYVAKEGHSRWIAVGASTGGIEAVSYDAGQKQAVISVEGARLTLALHESPASASETPAPTTPEAKAREARLLTGDLLDVGMQQRAAYAKAHGAASN